MESRQQGQVFVFFCVRLFLQDQQTQLLLIILFGYIASDIDELYICRINLLCLRLSLSVLLLSS